ncbi:MAG: response regulator [Rhodobacteraceae bacterium]|nr:MAG: response regulator [Paracoccaceae bacterium]
MHDPERIPSPSCDTPVARRRYDREKRARKEAEHLLEAKSRELYNANTALRKQAESLEEAIRQRTADLEMARVQAESANAAKSVFLATMSHEIRTPLNGVLGMAEALSDTPLTLAQRDMLNVVLQSGRLLQTVLNDILDLSKIEAGKYEIEDIAFNLADAVRSVEAMYSLKAEEKGLDFKIDFGPGTDGWITGDPNRLRQILGNLLSNAIKFTCKGSVHVFIEICTLGESHELLLIVKDTGKGVAPEEKEKLFKPYVQSNSAVSREFGGTGLGLSISRRFCQLMHGDLSVESNTTGGATFTARFRVSPAQPPQTLSDRGHQEDLKRLLLERPLRILAAEDNKTNQLVLRSLLNGLNLKLEIVSDGCALVAAWEQKRPDLVLMDIQMPVMNGLEATAAIRNAERRGNMVRTPIIALSANMMRHHEIEYQKIGMDSCVPKPFRKEQLLSVILACLRQANFDHDRPHLYPE